MTIEEFKEMPKYDQLSYVIWQDDGALFRKYSDWESMTSTDWAIWAILNSDRIKDCPFEIFEHRAWAGILSENPALLPEFLKHSKWDIFDGDDWLILLTHPEFVPFCDWNKLHFIDWKRLFAFTTKFADKCPWSDFDHVETEELLRLHPQLTSYAGLHDPQVIYIINDYPLKQEKGKNDAIPFGSLPLLEDTQQSLILCTILKQYFGYSLIEALQKKEDILKRHKTFVLICDGVTADIQLEYLSQIIRNAKLPIYCTCEPFRDGIFR